MYFKFCVHHWQNNNKLSNDFTCFLGSETKDLPVIKKDCKYESKKEYLDTYFKLLREECLHKIKKGISDFLNKGADYDSKDVMWYRLE